MRWIAYIGGVLYFASASGFFRWLQDPRDAPTRYIVFSLLGASFVAILFGYYMANMDQRYRKPSELTLDLGSTMEVRVFRASSFGVLAENCAGNELVFIPWSEIKSLQRSDGCSGKYDDSVPFTLKYLFL